MEKQLRKEVPSKSKTNCDETDYSSTREVQNETDLEQMNKGIQRLLREDTGDQDRSQFSSDLAPTTSPHVTSGLGQEIQSHAASVCRCRQAEFVAIYLIFNLGNTDALRLAMEWKSLLR